MLSPNVARHVIALSGVAANTLARWQRDPLSVKEVSRLRIENALAQLRVASPTLHTAQPLSMSGAAVGGTLDVGGGALPGFGGR
jgi:hypothetical protein